MTAQEDSLSQMETQRLLDADKEKEEIRSAATERRWADHTADISGRWAAANRLDEERWIAHAEIHRVHSETIEGKFQAHKSSHEIEGQAVKTALVAVQELASLHNIAHTREHTAHETRHEDQKEALRKAEMTIDKRVESINGYQAILRDQQATYITRDLSEEKHAEKEKRIEALTVDTNRRFEEVRDEAVRTNQEMRAVLLAQFENLRAAIVNIEKGDVKQEGKSLGQGAVVALIIGAVSLIGTVLGILVVLSNVLT